MQLFKFFRIFFRLPAALLRGIVPGPYPGSLLYRWSAIQLKHSSFKHAFIFIALLLIIQEANAQQTSDTTWIDTVSTAVIDTVRSNQAKDSLNYGDETDDYVDTTAEHIYDTSQFFFNSKEYEDDAYTQDKIAQRHLIDTAVKELKSQDDFWYIPAIEKLEMRLKTDPKFRDSLLKAKNHELTDDKTNFTSKSWFNTLAWCIVIFIFIAAIVYFLAQNKISIFSKQPVSGTGSAPGDEHEDIFQLSYTKLIQNAEKDKDYRVAIRLKFLQILKMLSDANAVHYQPDFTDLHYLQQLHQTKYYNDFFTVMRSYEYVWYGKFYISAGQYAVIKNNFNKLQNKIT